MSVRLSISGNGKLSTKDQSEVVISYGLDESATPTATVDTFGEIPTIGITGKGNDVQTLNGTHPTSKLLLNNSIVFEDSIRGEFKGKVTDVSISTNSVSINAQSKFEVLKSVKTSPSFNGTLAGAFASYLELGGLVSADYEIDTSFSETNVVYPGWVESVWVQLKLLCATVEAEMYFQNDKIFVKPIAQKSFQLSNSETESFKFEAGSTVKSFLSELGETKYVTNGIVKTYSQNENISQVDIGSKNEIILSVDFSIDSLLQPTYTVVAPERLAEYALPSSVGETPSPEDANGFYCFLNNSGVPVLANVALGSGANLKVEKTDNPFEVKVVVTGPIEAINTPWTVEFARNKGALMIVGSGVLVKRKTYTSNTGSAEGNKDVQYPINPFLIKKSYLYSSSFKSGQKLSGPNVIISLSTNIIDEADGQEFGFLPGAIFKWKDSYYRVIAVKYDYTGVDISAVQYVTFENFNTLWEGLTYDDFTDAMFDPATNPTEAISFSDFAIIPLMEPV
jgi:hypothetical protein